MTNCLLCKRELLATTSPGFLLHEDAEDCLVRVADSYGVSLDDKYLVDGDDIFRREPIEIEAAPDEPDPDAIELTPFKQTEQAIKEIFAEFGLERLGGISSGSGWSNVSWFQKCPYAWKRRYLEPLPASKDFSVLGEITALAVGTLIHTFLAVYYTQMIVADYPLTPEIVNQRVREMGCDPAIYSDAWRVFSGYRMYYADEEILPLAVEHDLKDPRTGHSCRYDLIAFFPNDAIGRRAGCYVIEHKSAARFTSDVLEGWVNDGEILGQIDLWDRLHLDRRFGPLQGVIVNLLGKQKDPQYHRTIVPPNSWQIDQHRKDLNRWNAAIQVAKANDNFPRARNSCIGRYGMCPFFSHCATGEE